MTSTGRENIIQRLAAGGHDVLLQAVLSGRISAFAAACEAGICKRQPIKSKSETNQSRRRRHEIARLLGKR
jgi:hypothetical protein